MLTNEVCRLLDHKRNSQKRVKRTLRTLFRFRNELLQTKRNEFYGKLRRYAGNRTKRRENNYVCNDGRAKQFPNGDAGAVRDMAFAKIYQDWAMK
jgi:hypothetical protein